MAKKKDPAPDVWSKIAAFRPQKVAIPEGAFTKREYMARFGVSPGAAHRELADLVATGKLGTEMGSSGSGKAGHPERMYWPI